MIARNWNVQVVTNNGTWCALFLLVSVAFCPHDVYFNSI